MMLYNFLSVIYFFITFQNIYSYRRLFYNKYFKLNPLKIHSQQETYNNQYGLSNSKFIEYMKMMKSANKTEEEQSQQQEQQNIYKRKNHLDLFEITININNEIDNNEIDDEVGEENQLNPDVKKKELNESPYLWKERYKNFYAQNKNDDNVKSDNFEIIKETGISYKDVGGYDRVKSELNQCQDILTNYYKYSQYNVRVPKGIILDGPPGTGKTLLAKAFATECNCKFIAVSGSDFQEKYIGVGSTRVKELFSLAKKNIPCIIFIDEIDAIGRQRSSDGESSTAEKDNTLNALLVEMDGFKNNTGIFVMAATNRIDLLDKALLRPGRIDKKIHIGLPDKKTRIEIINIHIKGKPHDSTIVLDNLVDITEGLSGAEIENLLNEAMLNGLRLNNTEFTNSDIQYVSNKMISGWQPHEHELSSDVIERVAVHEMGHAILAYFSKNYSKLNKVIINLSSPNMLGYTQLKNSVSPIYTKEALFEHLMIIFGGRIAEELIYGESITTGASMDIKEVYQLAKQMIFIYGMGNIPVYAYESEKHKEIIDNEIMHLLEKAYNCAKIILTEHKDLIKKSSILLLQKNVLTYDELDNLFKTEYKNILN